MKKAIFAGTFDPVTKGHEDVIKKATELFDFLTVAICINPDKKALYSIEKRLLMLEAVCEKYDNVEVVYHQGMLVDLMKEKGIKYNVRGVRNATDYEYENGMHYYNENLYKDIVTMYLPCKEEFKNVSSTAVRELLSSGENLEKMLSSQVINVIKAQSTK